MMTAADLNREIISQRKWLDEHGGDLAGYRERYGDPDMNFCYGDGGTAIYRADIAHLRTLCGLQRAP